MTGSSPRIELFGRYRLLRKLATGGMAEIFLAEDPDQVGARLVIKRLLPQLTTLKQFLRMFLDEARIAARLNHPNIVQIFDLGTVPRAGGAGSSTAVDAASNADYFIAMEYLHGADARRVWKRADALELRLPVAFACRVVMDAAAALHYAHTKTNDQGAPLGIVHRDVSPQNIFITFDGRVKLVDFGIAKAADQSEITKSGVVKGKFSYMSPEQAGGMRVDHRTDQFALGIVLHELLTARRLFKRNSDLETAKAIEACDAPPPSQSGSLCPASLDAVVLRALARRPEDRFTNCLELQKALGAWMAENLPAPVGSELAPFMQQVYGSHLAEDERAQRQWWETSTLDVDSGGIPSSEIPAIPLAEVSWAHPSKSLRDSTEAVTRPELRSGKSRTAGGRRRLSWALGVAVVLLAGVVGFWLAPGYRGARLASNPQGERPAELPPGVTDAGAAR